MLIAFPFDVLRDLLGLPALVFVVIAIWLVRKAVKAARTERDLEEEQRLKRALAINDVPLLHAVPVEAALVADPVLKQASLVAALAAGAQVLWIRSAGAHVAWGEKRENREVVCVARMEDGRLIDRREFV